MKRSFNESLNSEKIYLLQKKEQIQNSNIYKYDRIVFNPDEGSY